MNKLFKIALPLGTLAIIFVAVFAFSGNFFTSVEAQQGNGNGNGYGLIDEEGPRCGVRISEQDKEAREFDSYATPCQTTS